MNNKSKISSAQSAILIGTILYVVLPDLLIGPFDDAAVALIASIAELVLGFAKSRVSASSPNE